MKHNLTNKEYIGSYITGLFEAVGCIYIPKLAKKGKKKRLPKLILSFNKENKELANTIRDRIGHGAIYTKKTNLAYEIFNKDGIIKFIELTKDYYRTPRINKINEMIKYLNEKKKYNIPLIKINESSFDSNAWLSGYLETVGTFTISILKHKKKFEYVNRFTINHKKIDKDNHSYEEFLLKLAAFFEYPLKETETFGKKQFIIILRNINSQVILLNYIIKYNLFGGKYINYKIFDRAFDLYTNYYIIKEMTGQGYRQEVEELKKNLNNKIVSPEELKEIAEKLPKIEEE